MVSEYTSWYATHITYGLDSSKMETNCAGFRADVHLYYHKRLLACFGEIEGPCCFRAAQP